MQNSKSKKGLNYSILALIVFVSAIILNAITSELESEFLGILAGVLLLMSFALAIIGAINTIAGLKEGASMEQIIGMIISSVFILIICYILIEVIKLLNE